MDAMDFDFDEDNDLSSALGTETLAARDMVPEGFDQSLVCGNLLTTHGKR
jgi:hypothetical protein